MRRRRQLRGVPVPDPRRIDWDKFSSFLRRFADVVTGPIELIGRLERDAKLALLVGAAGYVYLKSRPQRVVVVKRR